MARARRANAESNAHQQIRNAKSEVLFSGKGNLNSETETEVIDNHLEQTFSTVRAKDYFLENSTLSNACKEIIIQLPQPVTEEAEENIGRTAST